MSSIANELPPGHPAPPEALRRVTAFINTRSIEDGTDELETAEGLKRFLAGAGWGRVAVAEDDRVRAVDVREALRALALANNGGAADPGAAKVLDRAAARANVAVRFGGEGSSLRPAARGVDGALGQMLAVVHEAMHDGTWPRVKACRDDGCAWAFYDLSKNRSACWCSMEVCGNRNKAKRFRQRHRA